MLSAVRVEVRGISGKAEGIYAKVSFGDFERPLETVEKDIR